VTGSRWHTTDQTDSVSLSVHPDSGAITVAPLADVGAVVLSGFWLLMNNAVPPERGWCASGLVSTPPNEAPRVVDVGDHDLARPGAGRSGSAA